MTEINQGPVVAWPRANLTNRALIIPLTLVTLTSTTSSLAMHNLIRLSLQTFGIFAVNCIHSWQRLWHLKRILISFYAIVAFKNLLYLFLIYF